MNPLIYYIIDNIIKIKNDKFIIFYHILRLRNRELKQPL